MSFTIKVPAFVHVNILLANIAPRYWEGSLLNGEEDTDGNMPCKRGDILSFKIDLQTGQILNWVVGNTAELHYKVCDAGVYSLWYDDEKIIEKDGYVPDMMSPAGSGYGDYVIMDIDENGFIQKWEVDLEYFEDED